MSTIAFSDDIDALVAEVRARMPEAHIVQTHRTWPRYDDQVVWLTLHGITKEIEMGSSFRRLP
ncbi:MAG: hypothetical protein ACO1TE_23660 [Prosthecobacter sp.]